MPTSMVVLVFPIADHDPGMQQRVEAVDVQTLVAEPRVERLDISVSPRLAWRNVGEPGSCARPVREGVGNELWPVVTAQHHRRPTFGNEFLEVRDEPFRSDGPFHKTT